MINVPNSIKEALSMNQNSNDYNKSKDSLNLNTRTEEFNKTKNNTASNNVVNNIANNTTNNTASNNTVVNNHKPTVGTYDNLPKGQVVISGQKVSLSKINPNINDIDVCITYDVSSNLYDLDSEAFLLGENEKVLGENWFVFYNQKTSPDNAVKHSSNGSEEIINVKLKEVES